jgi:hypothetical protein
VEADAVDVTAGRAAIAAAAATATSSLE